MRGNGWCTVYRFPLRRLVELAVYKLLNTDWSNLMVEWSKRVRLLLMQCSPLDSNSREPTKFVLIMKCYHYESALNIKCKYNGLSRDCNHLSELTGFLN